MMPKTIVIPDHFVDLLNGSHAEKSWAKQLSATSSSVWLDLISRGDEMAFEVAQNRTLDGEILALLVHHPHRSVRQSIAAKKELVNFPELYEILARDEDEGVRISCYTKDTPAEVRKWMESKYGYSLN